jgi:hypothetical protein
VITTLVNVIAVVAFVVVVIVVVIDVVIVDKPHDNRLVTDLLRRQAKL